MTTNRPYPKAHSVQRTPMKIVVPLVVSRARVKRDTPIKTANMGVVLLGSFREGEGAKLLDVCHQRCS